MFFLLTSPYGFISSDSVSVLFAMGSQVVRVIRSSKKGTPKQQRLTLLEKEEVIQLSEERVLVLSSSYPEEHVNGIFVLEIVLAGREKVWRLSSSNRKDCEGEGSYSGKSESQSVFFSRESDFPELESVMVK